MNTLRGEGDFGELTKMDEQYSRATVDSHLRHLRRIINYFKYEDKIIPEQYEYPFGTTTLMRAGVPIYDISQALGHRDIKTTIHYIASLDIERTFEINSKLL